jgi:hypothetical protein
LWFIALGRRRGTHISAKKNETTPYLAKHVPREC